MFTGLPSPSYTVASESLSLRKQYISEFYHEDAESYNKECNELEQLRRTAVQVSRDFVGCSTLKRYYSQLQFLQSRFPLTSGEELAIPFTWEDAHSGRPLTVADIKFEQASILYNIGSLHSILGSVDNRQTPEGMKVSCTHFQCAAWAYEHLRDNFGPSLSTDTESDLLSFQIQLMLAQAQECILEKSMADNRKSSITSKVAAQIVEFYRLALKSLDNCNPSNTIGNRKYKDWKRRLELKIAFHECVMYVYLSNQAEEQQSWGERLAYCTAAQDRLKDALKLAKADGDKDIEESLAFTMDVVVGKFNAAKKDNDFVYNEKIPQLDSLPEVKGASLVKGIPFNPQDTEVSGKDIFHRLVPMEAHEASSVYSEEKAKLLRDVGSRVESSDQELDHYLDSLQLDPAKISPEPERLPEALLEKCAALSVKPNAIKDLTIAMQSLSSIATDVEGNISMITEALCQDADREVEFTRIMGNKRTENVMMSEFGRECQKYQEGLNEAANSNIELHKAMNTHISNLKLLSSPLDELKQALPAVDLDRTPEDQAVIDEMTKLMGKVDVMRQQRASLLTQLRDQVMKDDITSTLVVRDEANQEVFFREQIKKHNKLVSLLDQNLTAQGNILRALTEANAKYAGIRRAQNETKLRRTAMIDGLLQSCDVYEDLMAKVKKGVSFYNKLDTNVSRLLERSQRVCRSQEEERQQIMERLKPKGPPPARPVAPKPGQTGGPVNINSPSPMPQDLPSTGAPTLKDFLPLMKPGTWSKSKAPDAGTRGPSGVDPALLAQYPGLASLDDFPDGQGASAAVDVDASLLAKYPGLSAIHGASAQGPSHSASAMAIDPSLLAMYPGLSAIGGAGQSAPDSRSSSASPARDIDPALLAKYPGLTAINQAGQNGSGQYSSLPGSHSASPVHLPRQPVSQPNSPLVNAKYRPQHPQSLSPVPAQYISPGALPGVDYSMVQSPTAAPGAPSSRRWGSESGGRGMHNGAPPGGPSSVYPSGSMVTSQYPGATGPQHVPVTTQGVPVSLSSPANIQYRPQLSLNQTYNTPPMPASSAYHPPAPQMHLSTQQAPVPSQQAPVPSQQAPASTHQPPVSHHHQPSISSQLPAVTTQQPPVSYPPSTMSQSQPPYQHPAGSSQMGAPGKPQHPPTASAYPQHQTPPSVYNQPLPSSTTAPHQTPVSLYSQHQTPTATYSQHQAPTTTYSQHQTPASNYSQPQAPNSTYAQHPTSTYSQPQAPTSTFAQHQAPTSTYSHPKAPTSTYSHPQAPTSTYSHPQAPTSSYSQPQTPASTYPQHQAPTSTYPQHQAPTSTYPQHQAPTSTYPQHQAPTSTYSQPPAPNSTYPQHQAPTSTYSQPPAPNSTYPQHQAPTSTYSQPQAPTSAYPQHQAPSSTYSQPQVPIGHGQLGVSYAQHPSGRQPLNPNPVAVSSQSQTLANQYPQPHAHPSQAQYTSTNISSTDAAAGSPAVSRGYVGYPQSSIAGGMQTYQGYPQNARSTAAAGPRMPNQNITAQSPAAPGVGQGHAQSQGHNHSQGFALGHPQTQAHARSQGHPVNQSASNYAVPSQPNVSTPQSAYVGTTQTVTSQYGGQSHGSYQGQLQQNQDPSGMLQGQQGQSGSYSGQSGSNPSHPRPYQEQPGQPASNQSLSGPYPVQGVSSQVPVTSKVVYQPPMGTNYTSPQQQSQFNPASQPHTGYPSQITSYPNSTYASQPGTQSNQPLPQTAQQVPANLPSPIKPYVVHPSPSVSPMPPSRESTPTHTPAPSTQTTAPQQTSGGVEGLAVRQSSVDDILSCVENTNEEVLTPKVITAEDLQREKEERMKNTLKQPARDPYLDTQLLQRFVSEVEKYDKLVDSLNKQTLSGPTPLEKEWKELNAEQEKISRSMSSAIARCYPLKNRSPDIIPYDNTRIILTSTNDDYINANHIGDLAPSCPKFIATQSPLPGTMTDFWCMVYEQGTEMVVSLCCETEGDQTNHVYWPKEKGQTLHYGSCILTLQSTKVKGPWEEHIITLNHKETRHSRSVVHLQFTQWPASGLPESPAPLLLFISEVHSFYVQQRSLMKPVIVHCSSGVGRTGVFCIVYTGVQQIDQGQGIVVVPELVTQLRQKRRWMVQDRSELLFCYQAIRYHAQYLLMKRGILTHHASFGDKLPAPGSQRHQRTPSDDLILGGTASLSSLQSSVARMSVKHNQLSKEEEMDVGKATADALPPAAVPVEGNVFQDQEPEGQDQSTSVVDENDTILDIGNMSKDSSHRTAPASAPVTQTPPKPGPQGHLAGNSQPISLADLQNPNTFKLDQTPPTKRKITKDSFLNKTSTLEAASDPCDPLSRLDPMWSIKPGQDPNT